jgi:hypothetical protein
MSNFCNAMITSKVVKWSLYKPWRRLVKEKVWLLLILNLGTRKGLSGQHHAPAELYPWVSIVQEAGWAPEPVWTQRLEEISSVSVRNRKPVF